MQIKIEEWFKVSSWKYFSRIHICYYNLDAIVRILDIIPSHFIFEIFSFSCHKVETLKLKKKNADLFMRNKSLQRKKFTFMGKWKVKYLIHNILRTRRGFLALQLNNRKLEEWSIQNFQKTISKQVHYFSGI